MRWRSAGRTTERDVVDARGEAAFEERADLRGEEHRLRAARRRAEADESLHDVGRVRAVRVRRLHEADRVVLHVPRDGHLPHELLHRSRIVVAVEDRLRLRHLPSPVVRSRMSWSSSRFGNGTWSLKRKRSSCASGSGYVPSISSGFCVARTTNGSSEHVRLLADGHAVLLHRLEQRALRLRRRAVDLVGEDDVREDRTLAELERLARALRVSSMTVVPRMSAGIRSGVNWMRENVSESVSASVRTSIVLPRPGTPSRSAWPPASMHVSTPSTTSALPTIVFPISVRSAVICVRNCSTSARTLSVAVGSCHAFFLSRGSRRNYVAALTRANELEVSTNVEAVAAGNLVLVERLLSHRVILAIDLRVTAVRETRAPPRPNHFAAATALAGVLTGDLRVLRAHFRVRRSALRGAAAARAPARSVAGLARLPALTAAAASGFRVGASRFSRRSGRRPTLRSDRRPDLGRSVRLGRPDRPARPDLAGRPGLVDRPDLADRPDPADHPDLADRPDLAGPGLVGRRLVGLRPVLSALGFARLVRLARPCFHARAVGSVGAAPSAAARPDLAGGVSRGALGASGGAPPSLDRSSLAAPCG